MSLVAAALAAGALCWPAAAGRSRLSALGLTGRGLTGRGLTGRGHARVPGGEIPVHWCTRRLGLLLAGLAAAMGALLAGLGGGLAAAMVSGTLTTRWRERQDRRTAAGAAIGLADALGLLVAELRAGAHPAAALEAAADAGDQPGRTDEILVVLAKAGAAARLGADVPAVLRGAAPAQLRPWLERLAQAWALADRYGIPLADLLDAVRGDTEHRVRFSAEIQARLAGPRATAAMLAGLPLLGLALGQALGAAPLRVLCQSPMGQPLLVIGTGLACVGVHWSAHLVSRAVPA
ncbi:MAG TPA: type II secretion system F family protein [Pseudonocardiaceae bacterium]|nr:type II secretion system F family protein [Pseudonocardiaceae bacterium]